MWLCLRSELACKIALEATATVALEEGGRKEIDIKRYAKVEKVTHKLASCDSARHWVKLCRPFYKYN